MYDSKKILHDIAVVRLKESVPVSNKITFFSLSKPSNINVIKLVFLNQFLYYTSGTRLASPAGGIRFLIFLLLVPAEIPVVDW